MTRYAHIQHLKGGVAFSDPWYAEDVWCQYRKAFTDTNWYMKLDAHDEKTEYGDILSFQLMFGRPTVMNSVRCEESPEGVTVFSPMRYRVDQVELGIDSGRIFCGNLEDFNAYPEEASFRTGGDGMFGVLFVFTVDGDTQPAGFALSCSFDPEFMTKEQFFDHMAGAFESKEISEKAFLQGISPRNLGNKMLLANETEQFAKSKEQSTPEKDIKPPQR